MGTVERDLSPTNNPKTHGRISCHYSFIFTFTESESVYRLDSKSKGLNKGQGHIVPTTYLLFTRVVSSSFPFWALVT